MSLIPHDRLVLKLDVVNPFQTLENEIVDDQDTVDAITEQLRLVSSFSH